MNYQLIVIQETYALSIKNTLLDMTVNNPIFILSVITIIWFIPGILVRRFNEKKRLKKKKENQYEAIQKLYPKTKE